MNSSRIKMPDAQKRFTEMVLKFGLTMNSTLAEIESKLGGREELEILRLEKKEVAPHWNIALRIWIEKINNELEGIRNPKHGGKTSNIGLALLKSYDAISEGRESNIISFQVYFFDDLCVEEDKSWSTPAFDELDMVQTPVKLTTLGRFKLTGASRSKLTTSRRSKLTTC